MKSARFQPKPVQAIKDCIKPLTTVQNANLVMPNALSTPKTWSIKNGLEVRKQGIGSSDAATACGLNPYMSMLELWMIKTGRMQNH